MGPGGVCTSHYWASTGKAVCVAPPPPPLPWLKYGWTYGQVKGGAQTKQAGSTGGVGPVSRHEAVGPSAGLLGEVGGAVYREGGVSALQWD